MPKLKNAKHEKFAQEYVRDPNMTRAYKAAGYSAKSDDVACACASRLLNNARVAARVAELQEEARSAAVADAQEILEYLTRGMRQELTEEVVVVEGDGNGVSHSTTRRKAISIKDSNKCAELLMKRLGMFDNSLSVTLTVPQFMGDDDLED